MKTCRRCSLEAEDTEFYPDTDYDICLMCARSILLGALETKKCGRCHRILPCYQFPSSIPEGNVPCCFICLKLRRYKFKSQFRRISE